MAIQENMAGTSVKVACVALVFIAFISSTASYDIFPKVKAFFQGRCNKLSPCHQRCINLPKGGFECGCWDKFKLHSNGFSCIGEDDLKQAVPTFDKSKEQSKNGVASQGDLKDGKEEVPSSAEVLPPEWIEDPLREDPSWDSYLRTSIKSHDKDPADMMMGDQPMQLVDGGNSKNGGEEVGKRDRDRSKEKGSKSREHHHGRRRKGRKNRNKDRHHTTSMENELADSLPPATANPQVSSTFDIDRNEESNNLIYENTQPPIKFHNCDELRCHAGGRCVPDEMRGGVRCQCRLGNSGDFCEQDIVVQFPKFMGTGYMAFPVLRGAYKEFTITLEFKPDTGNGLLLFSGEHPTARSDFFSISLIDGHAEFRFDCGTGLAQVTTINQVQLGTWNKLIVHRNDWNGWIQLNNGPQAKGRSRGTYTRITFREDLYLGGFRNNSIIGARTGMQWGFVGCVRYLEVNNKIYDMRKGAFVGDAIHGIDVGECSAHVCDKIKCHNGGTCIADSPDTHVCLCPLGTAGDRCENRIDIHVPSFTGSSYLQYIGLRRTVLSFAEIEIVFKAESPDGMIIYNGYTTDRSGDFISLAMVDGYLEYRFDLGTGPAIIKSRTPVTLNEWHMVRISRTGRDGYMQIDNQAAVEGMSKGAYTQLTLTLDLFVGGHRNFDEVAKNAGIRSSFKGCIQKIVINERPLKLMEEAINGINVDNCNHPCVGQPCLNGGRCVPIRDFYKCSCPLGFENTNCEDRKARRELSDPITKPKFSGDSYLKYTNPYILKRVKGQKVDIQMRIKAENADGLILWTSEQEMSSSSDYLALGLKDGHIQFSYNLGSGEVVIVFNQTRVDDGKWHAVRAQRYKRVGFLEIDGTEVIEGTSPGSLSQLNTQNGLFIGGTDDLVHGTLRKYKTGFTGCIEYVTLATEYHIDLIGEADGGENIAQCPGDKNRKAHKNRPNSLGDL